MKQKNKKAHKNMCALERKINNKFSFYQKTGKVNFTLSAFDGTRFSTRFQYKSLK